MNTISLITEVCVDDILDNLEYTEEEDFLLEVLDRFDINNVTAALRKHFALCKKEGLPIPDFIKKKEL